MKRYVVIGLVAAAFALLCTTASAALREGVRLKVGAEIIDVAVGHLVPCVTDWNNDGKRDLVVGQFSGGKIRLYLNEGTDSAPVLKESTFLEAGGAEISLPAG